MWLELDGWSWSWKFSPQHSYSRVNAHLHCPAEISTANRLHTFNWVRNRLLLKTSDVQAFTFPQPPGRPFPVQEQFFYQQNHKQFSYIAIQDSGHKDIHFNWMCQVVDKMVSFCMNLPWIRLPESHHHLPREQLSSHLFHVNSNPHSLPAPTTIYVFCIQIRNKHVFKGE